MTAPEPPCRPGRARPVRRAGLLMACVVLLLVPASAASADDIYEIDVRLSDAGFDAAYTEAFDAADRSGVRVVVDFASDSTGAEDFQRESTEVAETVWDHLEGEVLAIDVSPTYDVLWAPDGLPPAVSFDRGELIELFGARPAGLDDADIDSVSSVDDGLVFAGAALVAWVVSLVVAVVVTFFATRAATRRTAEPAWPGQPWQGQSWPGQPWQGQSWPGQPWQGQSWPGQPWQTGSWTGGGPPTAPPGLPPAQWTGPAVAGSSQPAADADPWRPLS